MVKEIIINSTSSQTRVAITEDGNLADFFVDYPENRRMVGDIYLGRIARVLPGIRAAFIDIGMKHDAFLHFSDIGERTQQLQDMLGDEDTDLDDEDENGSPSTPAKPESKRTEPTIPTLKKGQEILIQIIKEPVSNKGVRVTSSVSLPGRFCVLLPYDNKVGISKKIFDYKERKRLRYIARQIVPENYGLIIRTVAQKQDEEILKDDLKNLMKTWERIEKEAKTQNPPALVYQDLNTTVSVIRDLFNSDISKIFVDSKKLHKEIKNYLEFVQPAIAEKVELYKSTYGIFNTFKVDEQIKTLMGRKVSLPSGGYLIIEHTEAMVVIDVNSGKYAKSKDQESNSLKTDLEASREIARQLRLRDIGGIIVIDYIDLEDDKNRKKVYDELKKEFRKDRAKVSILPMSDFGLIQITRQRIRQNIVQAIKEVCPECHGTGLLTKSSHLAYDLESWLKKFRRKSRERSIIIKSHPSTIAKIREGKFKSLFKLQFKYLVKITLREDASLSADTFEFYSAKNGHDLTRDFD
ncbi:MAG: Rne/Rng family ribonuclease [Ignavibacteriaceae bacterium]|nr:Rne/Rng family ribonuclease [Ignavibacteriaceae bacterium]